MYDLLAANGNVFMHPIQFANIYYIKGVVKGELMIIYFLCIMT